MRPLCCLTLSSTHACPLSLSWSDFEHTFAMAGAEEVDRLGRGHRQRNAAPRTLLTFVQPTISLDAYDSSSIEELLTEAGCSWHLVQFAEAHEGCSAVFARVFLATRWSSVKRSSQRFQMLLGLLCGRGACTSYLKSLVAGRRRRPFSRVRHGMVKRV